MLRGLLLICKLKNRLDKFVTNINDVYNQLESKGEAFDTISLKEKLTDVKPQNNLWHLSFAMHPRRINL